jgi:hypothetical protein
VLKKKKMLKKKGDSMVCLFKATVIQNTKTQKKNCKKLNLLNGLAHGVRLDGAVHPRSNGGLGNVRVLAERMVGITKAGMNRIDTDLLFGG